MKYCQSLHVIFLLAFLAGCGRTPVNPSIDYTKKRKEFRVTIEDVQYPDGFPTEIHLLQPVRIYEQNSSEEGITWDTNVAPADFRDHYVKEFERLGYEPKVTIPKGLPGECYEIKAFDVELCKWHCVAVGKMEGQTQVSCFLLCKNGEAPQNTVPSKNEKPKSGK